MFASEGGANPDAQATARIRLTMDPDDEACYLDTVARVRRLYPGDGGKDS